MILRRCWIDAFGMFANFRLPASPEEALGNGLCLFLGPNEAGKSTLLEFVRRVFFGFPTPKAKGNHYEPVAGGRHGGWVEVEVSDGRAFRVERRPGARGGKVHLTPLDGEGVDANEMNWDLLLGSATEELFANIYAFGLAELQQFGILGEKGARQLIYGVGMGLRGTSLTKAAAQLDKQADELLKPKAGGRLNNLFAALDAYNRQIREQQEASKTFEPQRQELVERQEVLGRLQQERERLRKRQRYLEMLLTAHEPYLRRRAAEDDLAALPAIDAFPSQGLTRLETLLERLSVLQQQVDQSVSVCADLRTRLTATDVDEALLKERSRVETINQGLEQYRARLNDLPGLGQAVQASRDRLSDAFQGLGPDWTGEKVKAVDRSLQVEQDVSAFDKQWEVAEGNLAGARLRVEQAKADVEKRREQLQQAQQTFSQALTPDPPETHHWERVREAARKLRAFLPQRADLQRRVEDGEARLGDLQSRLRQAETEEAPTFFPAWPAVAAALSGLAAIITGFFNDVQPDPDRFIFGAVILLVALVAWRTSRRSRSQVARWEERQSANLQIARPSADEEKQRLEKARSDLQTLDDQIRQALDAAGLPAQALPDDLEEADLRAEKAMAQLKEKAQLRGEVRELEECLHRAEEERNARRQQTQLAEEKLQAAASDWRRWLISRQLPERLSPNSARAFFERVGLAQDRLRAYEETVRRRETTTQQVQEYEAAIVGLLRDMSIPAPEPVKEADILRLVEELRAAEKARDTRDSLTQQVRDEETRLAGLQSEFGSVRSGLENLLTEARVTSPEDFRQREEIYRRRQEVKKEIKNRRSEIINLTGEGLFAETCATLATLEPTSVAGELQQLAEKLPILDSENDVLVKEIDRRTNELQSLASSAELARLLTDRESTRSQLEGAAEEWAVVTLSQHLLDRTRRVYERERQPAVIRSASARFHAITRERYASIISPLQGGEMEVESLGGRRLSLQQLSRGTQEQLYLCLRFGLVEERDHNAEPLPVIMDDILVNFDPERARAAAEQLIRFAESRQLLFFTCHPSTVETFREIDADVSVRELSPKAVA